MVKVALSSSASIFYVYPLKCRKVNEFFLLIISFFRRYIELMQSINVPFDLVFVCVWNEVLAKQNLQKPFNNKIIKSIK